jgi:hypothetical protein
VSCAPRALRDADVLKLRVIVERGLDLVERFYVARAQIEAADRVDADIEPDARIARRR